MVLNTNIQLTKNTVLNTHPQLTQSTDNLNYTKEQDESIIN